MFAPYYVCPIMWSYGVPRQEAPRRYPVQVDEEDMLYLAWYYMVNYVY